METDTVPGIEPVELRDGLVFGRSAEADVLLPDGSVSRRHLIVRAESGGWLVEDLGSKCGSFLNGRLFERRALVYGDHLSIGPFVFRFDGKHLIHLIEGLGAAIECRDLLKTMSGNVLLDHISLQIEPGKFVGVIGPSGAGKSTFLDALCGLRPADSGTVLIDGQELTIESNLLQDAFGYVPQDDIVPRELTVQSALDFSARLRLPAKMPVAERRRLVQSVIEQMGLAERATTRVGNLSGGQRKRVSVAAELLGRPRLLFLDEPTSGLDPAAEFSLMQILRRLAANGCTIVCTTHLMDNAYLMDSLAVLHRGRLVFYGDSAAVREHFGIERLSALYERLREGTLPTWQPPARENEDSPDSNTETSKSVPRFRKAARRAAALPVLMFREWAILVSDWKNLAILLGQPIIIGILVTWVSRDPALVLFFAYIATLWFGCGNAAQEVVKDLAIYRRERLIGLGRHTYLVSKLLSISRITVVQSLLLYFTMQMCTGGITGSMKWQVSGLVATALASVSMGLAISALSRSVLQAVMLVPLILIPQILFSGFTPPAGKMDDGPFYVSQAMPSAAVQRIMDVSLLWGQKITGYLRVDYPAAFANLNRNGSLKNGDFFYDPAPAWSGLAILTTWIISCYWLAWFTLRRRERG